MDMNEDGHMDILVGSFEGGPFIIMGGKKGYTKPDYIRDQSGKHVVISAFWNFDEDKWDETDRAESEGHCTSASAVDWDNDGDLDLLLGDYDGGKLYLRKNEGTATKPSFANINVAVLAGGEPIVIEKGLAAPCIADWNNDGLFDILCGGCKGGVYLFQNTGKKGEPEFASAKVLIKPLKGEDFIKRVPSIDGEPIMPGSSYHITATDYDGDGDLDLLVGGRASWLEGPATLLSDEEKSAAEENKEILAKLMTRIRNMISGDLTKEEMREVTRSDEYRELMEEYDRVSEEAAKYEKDPVKRGDHVWVFKRR